MGMIRIETWGSFPINTKVFSAMGSGHECAVEDVLKWFETTMLDLARRQDKKLRAEGHAPEDGWVERDARDSRPETIEEEFDAGECENADANCLEDCRGCYFYPKK